MQSLEGSLQLCIAYIDRMAALEGDKLVEKLRPEDVQRRVDQVAEVGSDPSVDLQVDVARSQRTGDCSLRFRTSERATGAELFAYGGDPVPAAARITQLGYRLPRHSGRYRRVEEGLEFRAWQRGRDVDEALLDRHDR